MGQACFRGSLRAQASAHGPLVRLQVVPGSAAGPCNTRKRGPHSLKPAAGEGLCVWGTRPCWCLPPAQGGHGAARVRCGRSQRAHLLPWLRGTCVRRAAPAARLRAGRLSSPAKRACGTVPSRMLRPVRCAGGRATAGWATYATKALRTLGGKSTRRGRRRRPRPSRRSRPWAGTARGAGGRLGLGCLAVCSVQSSAPQPPGGRGSPACPPLRAFQGPLASRS